MTKIPLDEGEYRRQERQVIGMFGENAGITCSLDTEPLSVDPALIPQKAEKLPKDLPIDGDAVGNRQIPIFPTPLVFRDPL
ncbi:MAG: hypothetical protein ABJC13_15400 [Acidobacteriota bacterium]